MLNRFRPIKAEGCLEPLEPLELVTWTAPALAIGDIFGRLVTSAYYCVCGWWHGLRLAARWFGQRKTDRKNGGVQAPTLLAAQATSATALGLVLGCRDFIDGENHHFTKCGASTQAAEKTCVSKVH